MVQPNVFLNWFVWRAVRALISTMASLSSAGPASVWTVPRNLRVQMRVHVRTHNATQICNPRTMMARQALKSKILAQRGRRPKNSDKQ